MNTPIPAATGSARALASIETSPGVYQLMIGSANNGDTVLVRDSTFATFLDNGSAYESNFVVGAVVLAQPGELAELGFITTDAIRTANVPGVFVLIDEIDGALSDFALLGAYVSEPPLLYGATGAPASLYSNRYYFKQTVDDGNPPPAYCRFINILIDFGEFDAASELLTMTIYGSILVENG